MLKPAQLYKNELQRKYIDRWYDISAQYYVSGAERNALDIPDDPDNRCYFACVNHLDNVVGYFSYSIDWQAHSVARIGLISFVDVPNILLINDVIKHIKSLFANNNIRRVEWGAYEDNPAMRGYEKLAARFGGRKIGTYRQCCMLLDGKLHDFSVFEILKGGIDYERT